MHNFAIRGGLLLAALSVCGPALTAQVQFEQEKIVPADVQDGDYFGIDLEIDGSRMVIGAGMGSLGTDPTTHEGKAYIYEFDGTQWNETALLQAPDPAPGDQYGYAVALNGDTVVIGARFKDVDDGTGVLDDAGTVYVYHYDGSSWNLFQTLLSSMLAADEQFGDAVAMTTDRLVVGAPGALLPGGPLAAGEGNGRAYVYTLDQMTGLWSQSDTFNASDAATSDELEFGTSVDIEPGRLVVGGDHALGPNGEINAGGVYVFEENDGAPGTYTETIKLQSHNIGDYDHLGEHVALSGDRVIAGSKFNTVGGTSISAGGAYVWRYDGSTWFQEGYLFPSDTRAGDQLGASVDIDGDFALVGANRADAPGQDASSDEGAAYLFVWDGTAWVEHQKFAASDSNPGSLFGRSCTMGNDQLLIGSSSTDGSLSLAGGVYRYPLDPQLARATIDLGTGVNPAFLSSLDRPILGETWDTAIDTTAYPSASASIVVIYGAEIPPLSLPQGELLVDPTSPLYFSSLVSSGSGTDAHVASVPNDVALIGLPGYAQGVILAGGIVLGNGWDIQVGI